MASSIAKKLSVLVALSYLVFMFIMTHLPKQHIPRTIGLAGDKLLHTSAFLVLGFLLSLAVQLRVRSYGWYAYVIPTFVFGLLYGWFDELTQPLVGRYYDLMDLAVDGLGLVMGMLLFEGVRRLLATVLRIEELQ
jgi:VanZ family protein